MCLSIVSRRNLYCTWRNPVMYLIHRRSSSLHKSDTMNSSLTAFSFHLLLFFFFFISGRGKARIKGKFLITSQFYTLVTAHWRIIFLRYQHTCIACPQRITLITPSVIKWDARCRSYWQESREETNHTHFQHTLWHTCWDHLSKFIILHRPQKLVTF